MATPSSCVRCARPLEVGSAGTMCPECARTADADGPTIRQGGPHAVPITTARPGPAELPVAPPGYDLLKKLGAGGMGAVYLAREYATGRLVAMKFLHQPGELSAFDRFLVELRALAGVDHPGVVRVYASDFQRAAPFFTMEYLPGGSASTRLNDRGPFAPADAARLVAAAARAAHAAHQASVVHRDIKPSNILLAADGTPKVSDFGLAKRTDHEDGLTTTSGPLGTPGYMAPEQASRHFGTPGPPADVYGLGATLYHLLTGRPPFSGKQADTVALVLTVAPARPRAIRTDVPAALEAVVMKCLEKPPGRRYPTAAALADDLDRFLAGGTPEAPVLTPARRAWRAVRPRLAPVGLAAALLAVVFALGAAVWPRPRAGAVAPADPVAAIREELTAGRPAGLVGATGLPRYHRCVIEPNTLGESPLGDGTCSFNTFGHALLELFPAPGVPHYRVDLELRHLQSQAAAAAGDKVETDYIGAYFGYSSGLAADGSGVHAAFALTFRDSDFDAFLNGIPPRKQPVSLSRYGFHQPGDVPPLRFSNKVASLQFTPPKLRPGSWRPLSFECAPDRLLVLWRDDAGKAVPLVDWNAEKVRAEYDAVRAGLDKMAPGAGPALSRWNPNAPFGLVGFKASIAVRNVVITPLP